jgi:hypothetical protein
MAGQTTVCENNPWTKQGRGSSKRGENLTVVRVEVFKFRVDSFATKRSKCMVLRAGNVTVENSVQV